MQFMQITRKRIVLVFIVLALVLSLAYWPIARKAKEHVLREDLYMMRATIDQYTLDKNHLPQSLNDLVAAGYVKQMPTDPFTGRNDTWVWAESGDPKMPGIIDVHSGSNSTSISGSRYREW